jgi:hypothetical protein
VSGGVSKEITEIDYFLHYATFDGLIGREKFYIDNSGKTFSREQESKPDSPTPLPQRLLNQSVDDDNLYAIDECTAPSKSTARLAARAHAASSLSYQIQSIIQGSVAETMTQSQSEDLNFFANVVSQHAENTISGIRDAHEETSDDGTVWIGVYIPKRQIATRIKEEIEKRIEEMYRAIDNDLQKKPR